MRDLLEAERPWIELFHPEDYALLHGWLSQVKATGLTVPVFKYYAVDPAPRAEARVAWNRPVRWPAWAALVIALAVDCARGRHLGAGASLVLAYLLRRLVWGAVTIVGVLLFLFWLFFLYAKPEDVARRALGEKAPPEAIAQWLTNHGYDRPALWNPEAPLDTRLFDHLSPDAALRLRRQRRR